MYVFPSRSFESVVIGSQGVAVKRLFRPDIVRSCETAKYVDAVAKWQSLINRFKEFGVGHENGPTLREMSEGISQMQCRFTSRSIAEHFGIAAESKIGHYARLQDLLPASWAWLNATPRVRLDVALRLARLRGERQLEQLKVEMRLAAKPRKKVPRRPGCSPRKYKN